MISKRFEMKPQDWVAVKDQAIKFLFPVVALYLSPIIFVITQEIEAGTFVFSLSYFVPSQLVIGGIVLFLLNRIYDPIIRYISEHKV